MNCKTTICSKEILKYFFEFADTLNLKVKTTKNNGLIKYSFKYKNRTILIAKIKDNSISVSVVLWLLDLYYNNTNPLSQDVENAVEHTKSSTLVYDMFGKHCISYSFRFNDPSLEVIEDLQYLLQEEVHHIEKL